MARGVNKAIIVGHLGRDPEIRYTAGGDAVANLNVATTDSWRDKQTGENTERTEWHRVVMFRRLAEIAGEYLKKGSQVYIEGRLQTRKWQDQSGQERYTTEIVANDMQMLGGRSGAGGGESYDQTPRQAAPRSRRPTRAAVCRRAISTTTFRSDQPPDSPSRARSLAPMNFLVGDVQQALDLAHEVNLVVVQLVVQVGDLPHVLDQLEPLLGGPVAVDET